MNKRSALNFPLPISVHSKSCCSDKIQDITIARICHTMNYNVITVSNATSTSLPLPKQCQRNIEIKANLGSPKIKALTLGTLSKPWETVVPKAFGVIFSTVVLLCPSYLSLTIGHTSSRSLPTAFWPAHRLWPCHWLHIWCKRRSICHSEAPSPPGVHSAAWSGLRLLGSVRRAWRRSALAASSINWYCDPIL